MKSLIKYSAVAGALALSAMSFALAAHNPPTSLTKTTADIDNTPTFSWSAPNDSSGTVASYEVRVDSASYANIGNVTTYTSSSVLADGSHTFSVRAKDTSGNVGSAATLSFMVDTVAPAVGAITPVTASAGVAKTFLVSYSDAVGVNRCDLYVDGSNRGAMALAGTTSGTASVTFLFSSSGTSNLHARCLDAAGNVGIGSTTAITVGPTPSDTSAPGMPPNLRRTSPASDSTPTFAWDASSDNVGVVAYEVRVDGAVFMDVGNVLTYTTGVLTEGGHAFSVRAKDAAGHVSAVSTLTFTIGAVVSPPPSPPPSFGLDDMRADSEIVITGDMATLRTSLGVLQCELQESEGHSRAIRVFSSIANESTRAQVSVFTACGTRTTLHLGAGERLGVVNSYRAAFGRLPLSVSDWNDVVKIANGRFPAEASATAEANAKVRFRMIYRREPNMLNENDKAAVTVMAYGLRPLPRNLTSEGAAIVIFKAVFGYHPTSATDWDAVRAIAYSGAIR